LQIDGRDQPALLIKISDTLSSSDRGKTGKQSGREKLGEENNAE
jgi:hypothetical protein